MDLKRMRRTMVGQQLATRNYCHMMWSLGQLGVLVPLLVSLSVVRGLVCVVHHELVLDRSLKLVSLSRLVLVFVVVQLA